MELKNYETTFIMTPVLSKEEIQETVNKFQGFLENKNCKVLHKTEVKLRKLSYPIQKKMSGLYQEFEFQGFPNIILELEQEYRLEKRVIRYLTIALDKHGMEYKAKKRLNIKSDTKQVSEQKTNESNRSLKKEPIIKKNKEKKD